MTTKDSNLIANPALSPPVLNDPGKLQTPLFCAVDNFEVATGDINEIGDIIRLARLPSHARVTSILISVDDLDSNGAPTIAYNVGIYTTAGAVKDADAFAAATTGAQAGQRLTELIDQAATVVQVANCGDPLWAWAGDSADPGVEYDICLTLTAAAATPQAGTIAFIIYYTVA